MRGIVFIFIGGMRLLAAAFLAAFSGGMIVADDMWVRAYPMLRRAGYFSAAMIAGVAASWYLDKTGPMLVFAAGLAVVPLALFTFVNSSKHMLYNWAGLNINPATSLASVVMFICLLPILRVAIPAAFSGSGGLILSCVAFLAAIEWVWGQITYVDPWHIPRMLRISAWTLFIWILLTLGIRTLVPDEFARYFGSVYASSKAEMNRRALENERESKLTIVRMRKRTPVYSGILTDGQLAGLRITPNTGDIIERDENGKIKNALILEVDDEVKARYLDTPLVNPWDDGEPLIEIQVQNQFGQYVNISGKKSERLFVPLTAIRSKPSISNPTPTSLPAPEAKQVNGAGETTNCGVGEINDGAQLMVPACYNQSYTLAPRVKRLIPQIDTAQPVVWQRKKGDLVRGFGQSDKLSLNPNFAIGVLLIKVNGETSQAFNAPMDIPPGATVEIAINGVAGHYKEYGGHYIITVERY